MAIKYRVYVVSVIFAVLMLTPLVYLTRYQVVEADKILAMPNELRLEQTKELRGSIMDRNRHPLAYSKGRERLYEPGESLGSLIGCNGAEGLDVQLASLTEGRAVPRQPLAAIRQIGKGDLRGDDIVLTIDSKLQADIYELLNGYLGACVVMNATNGELLALVSRPSYANSRAGEPEYWEKLLKQDVASPLSERCLTSRYEPGSTMKLLMMSAVLSDGKATADEQFTCHGEVEVGNYVLPCMATHGTISLTDGLAYSCNVVFALLGERLYVSGINTWAKQFGLTDELPYVPGAEPAHLPTNSSASSPAEAAIGQADWLVSPLHVARIASVIANKGHLIEPVLVKGVWRHEDWEVEFKTREVRQVISEKVAAQVADAMVKAVQEGTCTRAGLSYAQVAGKSGSAENPHGDAHAWFVGYAPADKPRIVCAVVLENAGGGGHFAAPIAREVLDMALSRY